MAYRPGVEIVSQPQPGHAPERGVCLVGALLAVAVSAVHVADQGGITRLTSPDWIGWSYRFIEASGVLTALLLVPRPPRFGPGWLGWAVAVPLGAGPFVGYVASRTVGLPGDPHDVGNWAYWVGTVSLLVEAALVMLGVSTLWSHRSWFWSPARRAQRRLLTR